MTYGTRRDDNSPGNTSEVESRQNFQSSVSLPSPPGFDSTGQMDPQSIPESPTGSSAGTQTLATLKQEAIKEKRQSGRQVPARTRTRGPPRSRRRNGRTMKEEYFDSMTWTRTFVSEPLYPNGTLIKQIAKFGRAMSRSVPRAQRQSLHTIPQSVIYAKSN